MARIVDVTEEKEREKKQAKLEWELAQIYFKRNKVFLGDQTILVHKSTKLSQPVMFKLTGEPKMTIYDKAILSEAERFAEAYQENFPSEQEFVIKTNYS